MRNWPGRVLPDRLGGAADLPFDLTENDLLRREQRARADELLDQVALRLCQRNPRAAKSSDAALRVLQRLAELERRAAQIGAEDRRDVGCGLRRAIEDVVPLTSLVPDRAERKQHVRARLDELVIDAGQRERALRQFIDLLGRGVRRAARGLDQRDRRRTDLRHLRELVDGRTDRGADCGADEEGAGGEGDGPEEPGRGRRRGEHASRVAAKRRLGVLDATLDRLRCGDVLPLHVRERQELLPRCLRCVPEVAGCGRLRDRRRRRLCGDRAHRRGKNDAACRRLARRDGVLHLRLRGGELALHARQRGGDLRLQLRPERRGVRPDLDELGSERLGHRLTSLLLLRGCSGATAPHPSRVRPSPSCRSSP